MSRIFLFELIKGSENQIRSETALKPSRMKINQV